MNLIGLLLYGTASARTSDPDANIRTVVLLCIFIVHHTEKKKEEEK
jgi:hypothetical protein